MEEKENGVVVVDATKPVAPVQSDITGLASADDLVFLGEQAEKRVNAVSKIMAAAYKITTPYDWVLIDGKPYLQESGVTKIANLIGISFEIEPGFPIIETDSQGYKTYTYRVRAYGSKTAVQGEGSRSMREDFFRKSGKDKEGNPIYKQPEEIKDRDVRIAAFTNAKSNAIKSIIPGLKNLSVEDLQNAGFNVAGIKGYSHNTGSKGGTTAKDSPHVCEHCGKQVSQNVASYSQSYYQSHILCPDCQNLIKSKKITYAQIGQKVETPTAPAPSATPAPSKSVPNTPPDEDFPPFDY